MARTIQPPLGVGILDTNGYMNRAWVQWFTDVYNNTAEGLVELNSTTLSSVDNHTITSDINADYEHYRVVLSDIKVSQPNDILNIRVSEDTGVTYKNSTADYDWIIESNSGSSAISTDAADSEITLNSEGFSNTTTGHINGVIDFFTPANSSNAKTFRWDLTYENNSGNLTMTRGTGRYLGTGAFDAIKFYLNTGKLSSGKIKIYGIK